METSYIFSFVFSVVILADGFNVLRKSTDKKQKNSGIMAIVAGIMFTLASVTGVIKPELTGALLIVQWALYIVGFIIFLVSLKGRKK